MMMNKRKKQVIIPRGPRTQEENNNRGKHRSDNSDKGMGKTKKAPTAVQDGANGLKYGCHGKKKRGKILAIVLVVLLVLCVGAVSIFVYLHN